MSEHKTRAEQAADTRNRVLEHAKDLFLAHGFPATSTRQIAAAAGVTERTLFNITASKSELLKEVVSKYVFDKDQRPLLQRSDFDSVLKATAADQLLREFARWVTDLHERSAPLAEMVRVASAVDVAAAEVWAAGSDQQVADCLSLILLLRERRWLADRVVVDVAADSIALLTGHETYWRLATQRNWPSAQYIDWLVHHLQTDLIDRSTRHRTS